MRIDFHSFALCPGGLMTWGCDVYGRGVWSCVPGLATVVRVNDTLKSQTAQLWRYRLARFIPYLWGVSNRRGARRLPCPDSEINPTTPGGFRVVERVMNQNDCRRHWEMTSGLGESSSGGRGSGGFYTGRLARYANDDPREDARR